MSIRYQVFILLYTHLSKVQKTPSEMSKCHGIKVHITVKGLPVTHCTLIMQSNQ